MSFPWKTWLSPWINANFGTPLNCVTIGQSTNVHLFVCAAPTSFNCRPRNGVQAWGFRDPTAQWATRFGGRVIGDGIRGRANRTRPTACHRRDSIEEQTKRIERAWLDVHARVLWERQTSAFFMLGYVTQTRIPTERWPHSKFTSSTKQKSRGNIHHG